MSYDADMQNYPPETRINVRRKDVPYGPGNTKFKEFVFGRIYQAAPIYNPPNRLTGYAVWPSPDGHYDVMLAEFNIYFEIT
jgi:hypothetical protein